MDYGAHLDISVDFTSSLLLFLPYINLFYFSLACALLGYVIVGHTGYLLIAKACSRIELPITRDVIWTVDKSEWVTFNVLISSSSAAYSEVERLTERHTEIHTERARCRTR